MKKIISFSLLSLFILSCAIKQDPLASFPKEIRNGIPPDHNTVLKPIPRGVVRVASLPKSPLVFHKEKIIINLSVRFLQGFKSKYEIDILNLSSLPGTAVFDKAKYQISWTPDLSLLDTLFAYIPIHIRVNVEEPRPLYIEHTIYARAYRALKGVKLKSISVKNFTAGSKKALVTWVVKDLDASIKIDKKSAQEPRLMLTQKGRAISNSLLSHLKFINPPRLESWNDPSTWLIEAYFNLSKLKLSKKTKFYLSYDIFSSFGKSFGLTTQAIFIKPNPAPPPAPKPAPVPAPKPAPVKDKFPKKKLPKKKLPKKKLPKKKLPKKEKK